MPKHLMTKLNIPEPSFYMSPLRAIVLSQKYRIITVIWSFFVLFAPLLNMRRCIVWDWCNIVHTNSRRSHSLYLVSFLNICVLGFSNSSVRYSKLLPCPFHFDSG